jgi:cell shape-determining protein MreD
MSELLKNIVRFFVLIFVQVFILNKIPPLHQFIAPYLYFVYLLWLPYKISRLSLTLLGFIYGLCLDFFTKTPGLHASACLTIAYLRPFLINILISKDDPSFSYASPAPSGMGWPQYLVYILALSFIHSGWLVFLEWLSFGNIWFFLGKVIATTGVSFLLILLTEILFYRKQKFRTNN